MLHIELDLVNQLSLSEEEEEEEKEEKYRFIDHHMSGHMVVT